jgi:hypothetical protein
MARIAFQDARRDGARLLLLVVFFIFLFLVFQQVAIFANLALFFLFVFFIQVIGDEIQMDGVRLRDFQFGFAFRTTQDLAFLDFVFIHVDFSGTLRATDHGSHLRRVVRIGAAIVALTTAQRIIYRNA